MLCKDSAVDTGFGYKSATVSPPKMSKPTTSSSAGATKGTKPANSRYHLPPPPPDGEVYGILIPCEGDKRRLRTPPFISIHLPPTHGVFQLEPTPVSAAVGFPLIVCQTNSLPVNSTPRQELDNQIATYLCIDRVGIRACSMAKSCRNGRCC